MGAWSVYLTAASRSLSSACIAGHAVAGGLELACWCDLRVVEQSAVFGVFCRRWGTRPSPRRGTARAISLTRHPRALVPPRRAPGVPLIDGGTFRLPRLIGFSRAMDMILTGRPVKADEALQIGRPLLAWGAGWGAAPLCDAG